jgi:hypothetical protein
MMCVSWIVLTTDIAEGLQVMVTWLEAGGCAAWGAEALLPSNVLFPPIAAGSPEAKGRT